VIILGLILLVIGFIFKTAVLLPTPLDLHVNRRTRTSLSRAHAGSPPWPEQPGSVIAQPVRPAYGR
jgi:hypothetical protein